MKDKSGAAAGTGKYLTLLARGNGRWFIIRDIVGAVSARPTIHIHRFPEGFMDVVQHNTSDRAAFRVENRKGLARPSGVPQSAAAGAR